MTLGAVLPPHAQLGIQVGIAMLQKPAHLMVELLPLPTLQTSFASPSSFLLLFPLILSFAQHLVLQAHSHHAAAAVVAVVAVVVVATRESRLCRQPVSAKVKSDG